MALRRMSRLDVRVNTCISAVLRGRDADGRATESAVTIVDLSLGGALLAGISMQIEQTGELLFKLQDYGRVRLAVQSVRCIKGRTAVRLIGFESAPLSALWRHVLERMVGEDHCPYCAASSAKERIECERCGLPFDFGEEDHLDRHLVRTFLPRIEGRLASPRPQQVRQLLSFIDNELLQLASDPQEEEFVGTSPCMMNVFSMIKKIAPTDMNVLILGESGTGKELTARAIHERSERKEKPFVAINCAAIPETLLEAELFGFEKGSFTGALSSRKGKFEQADGGTLFLDEIGDLPASLQSKLLRFLEDRVVERIGGQGGKRVDVRILAATNCNLTAMMERQDFRRDLFFRLNSFTITLQPLRNRGEDKLILARFFLDRISRLEKCPPRNFSPHTVKAIEKYDWPGNVRELINKIRRGLVMAAGDLIEPEDMELHGAPVGDSPMKDAVARSQRELVLNALEENGYVVARAARALGVSRPNIYHLMKKFEIDLAACKERGKIDAG